jgi:hypothetical protein
LWCQVVIFNDVTEYIWIGDDVQCDVVIWAVTRGKHRIGNTGVEILKLVIIFIPAYGAEHLLGNILGSAEKSYD